MLVEAPALHRVACEPRYAIWYVHISPSAMGPGADSSYEPGPPAFGLSQRMSEIADSGRSPEGASPTSSTLLPRCKRINTELSIQSAAPIEGDAVRPDNAATFNAA